MMGSHSFPIHEVVLVGVLLGVVVVCLLAMLRVKRPDPKFTLLHGLMHDLPREEEGERPSAQQPAESDDDESEIVPGPRSYDFFA